VNDFSKARQGQPLSVSARTWNRMVDAVNPAAGLTNLGPFEPRPINFTIIGKNQSSTGVSRWGCMAITGVIPLPSGSVTGTALQQFERQPAIAVDLATSTTKGRFVVAVEPVANGEYGLFAIDGVVQTRLNVSSESHQFATPKPGRNDQLDSASTGEATILWKEPGTGLKWAIIRIGAGAGGGLKLGKITGTWAKGAAATVYEYSGDTASGVTGPSGTIASLTATNRFATVNVLSTGPSGARWVALGLIGATWHLIAAECGT
jgi:hypothetical protein